VDKKYYLYLSLKIAIYCEEINIYMIKHSTPIRPSLTQAVYYEFFRRRSIAGFGYGQALQVLLQG